MNVYTKTVPLTEAQIEGLYSGAAVPLTVVEAPGAGYALTLVSAQFYKTAGNAATAGTTNINFSYGTATTAIATLTSVNATTGALGDNAQNRIQNAAMNGTNAVAAANQPINISASAAIAAATGTTAKLIVSFMIVKL